MISEILQTTFNLLLIYISAKFTLWLIRYFYEFYVYSKVPGPWNIPFIGGAIKLLVNKSKYTKVLIDISNEYYRYPFYKSWLGTRPFLVFHKHDYLEFFLSSSKNTDKSIDYNLLHDWLHFGLLTSGGEKWTKRRKLLTPSFHFDILKSYLLTINEEADIFVQKISEQNLNKKIELLPFITRFTLDTICSTAMGENVNVQCDEESEYLKSVLSMCDLMIQRSKSPWLWIDPIFRLSKYGKIQNECLKVLHGFTRSIIHKRADDFQALSGDNTRRVAFLDVLLQAKLDDPNSFTFDDIQEEVDTFVFEGHDTTKSAINWTLYAIANHPEVQEKIYEEIEHILGHSNDMLSTDDLNRFEYLECVIKESLRIYPPVPMIGRVLSEDTIIDGKKLLKGTQVTIFIHQVHRDERLFPDPEKFNPDRFLAENSMNRHPYGYIPFSAGKRNCIGQRFAMMEIKVALVKLLRKYRIACDQTVEDIKLVFEVILRNEEPILFTLKPRISDVES